MSRQSGTATVAQAMGRHLDRARLRILIVGGGIAGLTLAALLRQRGESPVLVERQAAEVAGGYMLGLLPLGGRVLHGLGLHAAYLDRSCPMQRYEIHGRRGALLKSYSLERIVRRFGAYRGIERGHLVALLREGCDVTALFHACTVAELAEGEAGVEVTFSDGSAQCFDLVVGADGLRSDLRNRVFDPADTSQWKTGWGGWVYWVPPLFPGDATYREVWSAGWGLGLYPVRDRLGLFLAGDLAGLEGKAASQHAAWVRERLPAGPFRDALARIDPHDAPFFWKMEDVRAKTWRTDRIVLLGDAAAGFLPTAGVGASMAMDSAAALADELSRAEPGRMGYALSLYEARQRGRVERAQKNSRALARFMFVDSTPGAFFRDQMMRFYSLDMLVRGISRVITAT